MLIRRSCLKEVLNTVFLILLMLSFQSVTSLRNIVLMTVSLYFYI